MANTEIMKSTDLSASLDSPAAGDIAASVFTRFDRGMPPDEVVTELVLPVDTVECLWRTWARLRGAVLLSAGAGQAPREASYSHQPIAGGRRRCGRAALRRAPVGAMPAMQGWLPRILHDLPRAAGCARGSGQVSRLEQEAPCAGHPSELHRAVEPAPARDGGVLIDVVADVEAGLIDAPAPHSRPVEEPHRVTAVT